MKPARLLAKLLARLRSTPGSPAWPGLPPHGRRIRPMSFQHAPEPADFIVQRARIRLMEEDDAGLQDAVDQMLVAPLATPSTPPPLR